MLARSVLRPFLPIASLLSKKRGVHTTSQRLRRAGEYRFMGVTDQHYETSEATYAFHHLVLVCTAVIIGSGFYWHKNRWIYDYINPRIPLGDPEDEAEEE